MLKSRDARELQRCNRCYWYNEHSLNSGDPDTCRWDPNELWDIIDDNTRAIDCQHYVSADEIDKLARGYCRAMAASPEVPPPEFGEDSVKVWTLDNNAYKLGVVEIRYEE